ncbi:MAG: glycosyltransferase family 4 protein [Gammaproteobacteria bacterium]|nr:glycosyltransferase family 4 protein [Gammaproteobacteria bacterium]
MTAEGKHAGRILVLTELFLPTKGGTAVWFDEVYQRLGGKEIHVVTADVPGADNHDRHHKNTIHRIAMQRHPWLRPESIAMYYNLFKTSIKVGIKNSIETIHAGRVLPEGLVGWLVARLLRKNIVIYAHGEEITTWRESGKFNAMLFAYSHADTVIANSDFTRNELLKLGISPSKIVLISPGVDIERFHKGLEFDDLRRQINLGKQGKLVLSVGRLSRRKGFDQIIECIPELVRQGIDVHYAIIGIGEDQQYLEKLMKEKHVEDRVHFLGHVSMDDLPRWYCASDIFAMPNREINGDTEGFGMVFMEAAACGKPVIAGKAGGTGAAVIDNTTGLRVNGGDVEAVLKALSRLLSDEDYAHSLGEQGFIRATGEFSWEKVAERTKELIL